MATIKSSKSKATSTPKKTSGAEKSGKSKIVSTPKSTPSEEKIREKAKEIYHERLKRGEYGTALDDWHKAEKLLKGS